MDQTIDQKNAPKRLFALDILRGVAAALVLIHHLPDPYPHLSYSQVSGWEADVVIQIIEMGWIGVDLFFVLSGFLISGLLYREVDETGGLKVKRFLLRRGFKIWPCYFAAYGGMTLFIALRAALSQNWTKVESTLGNGFWNSVFLQNYVECVRWAHSWSIAVEEHFYLFLPMLFLLILRFCKNNQQRLSAVPWTCLTIIVLAPLMRIATLGELSWVSNGYDWESVYFPSHLRADSLCFGVLIGYIFRYHRDLAIQIASFKSLGIPLVFFSFAVPLIWPLQEHSACGTIGFTIIALGFSWLVLAAGLFPETGKAGNKIISIPSAALAWIGIYSYTIYLAHSIIFSLPGTDFSRRTLLSFLSNYVNDVTLLFIDACCFWTLSILLGLLLSKMIELPFLKLRSKLIPSHYIKPVSQV